MTTKKLSKTLAIPFQTNPREGNATSMLYDCGTKMKSKSDLTRMTIRPTKRVKSSSGPLSPEISEGERSTNTSIVGTS